MTHDDIRNAKSENLSMRGERNPHTWEVRIFTYKEWGKTRIDLLVIQVIGEATNQLDNPLLFIIQWVQFLQNIQAI